MQRGTAVRTRKGIGLRANFFPVCRKYGVRWASADEKERWFIEEVTRVTYERERAVRLGLPLADVRPAFAS